MVTSSSQPDPTLGPAGAARIPCPVDGPRPGCAGDDGHRDGGGVPDLRGHRRAAGARSAGPGGGYPGAGTDAGRRTRRRSARPPLDHPPDRVAAGCRILRAGADVTRPGGHQLRRHPAGGVPHRGRGRLRAAGAGGVRGPGHPHRARHPGRLADGRDLDRRGHRRAGRGWPRHRCHRHPGHLFRADAADGRLGAGGDAHRAQAHAGA